MHYPYFDTSTIVLYSVVGTICMLSVHIAKSSKHYDYKQTILGLSMMIGTLVLFAALRKIGLHLGGEDSQRYEEAFINFYNHGADRYEDTDILFGYLTGTLRFFTDSAIVYRICCYGIIAFGYAYFIRYICPNGVSSIPFI